MGNMVHEVSTAEINSYFSIGRALLENPRIERHDITNYDKGRSIYYVRTEGGEGVKEVANFANDKTDRLRETANKGGVQNPNNFANVINGCPLTEF